MINKNIKILFTFCMALFVGCSTPIPKGKTEAEVLYREAVKNVKDERYLLAIEKINTIKSQHPYSYYATPAELLYADVLYNQENYIEAAAAYRLFMEFHPKYKKMNYVLFKLAESYFGQLPTTHDRDISVAGEALNFYRELLVKFPGSPYDSQVKTKIIHIEDLVLRQELYIAHFYYKTDVFESARYRYQYILKNYKKQDIRDLCALRIVESSFYLKEYDKCLNEGSKVIKMASKVQQQDIKNILEKCKTEKSKL